ncbi:hypothetical protein AJ79_09053 [Helicocarpus griseus UAMH5409]|uniref:Uncharacterized protein n=1 Tax=Helicocarpus griseus UAMH5409 TaxID=1447875 RepID=A0A2B7WN06_9EURO|nr:hypothetical protein AJ79_09053 [Helicocarpus griseus UAMH5409]
MSQKRKFAEVEDADSATAPNAPLSHPDFFYFYPDQAQQEQEQQHHHANPNAATQASPDAGPGSLFARPQQPHPSLLTQTATPDYQNPFRGSLPGHLTGLEDPDQMGGYTQCPPIDPALLQPRAGELQGEQQWESLFVQDEEEGDSGVFHRDRSAPGDDLLSLFEGQFPVEDTAEGHSLPEPSQQQQTGRNQRAANSSSRAKKPRKPKDKPAQTGRHSTAEQAAVEEFKRQLCHAHGLSGEDFGRMVQHCETIPGDFPCPESIMTRTEFWDNLYALMPGRKHKDVQRYMRSHYVAGSEKPRQWTRAQDDELAALYAEHGNDFAKIARILGRARDDVNTRFRKHVQHRDTQLRGPWTDEECARLESAVQQWRDEQLLPDDTADPSLGDDIYQIDPHDILWTRVSALMGHTRTREQCSSKWKVLRKKRDGSH